MNDDWNRNLKRDREKARLLGIERAGVGLHAHRLQPEAHCPREVAFAAAWQREHERTDLLAALFAVPCTNDDPEGHRSFSPFGGKVKFPLGDTPTDRDRLVSATVVQWLASNVGLSFVAEALKDCGYRIEQLTD